LKLNRVGLFDTASIYPEILEAIAGSLLSTEPNLSMPSLKLPRTFYHVVVGNLFIVTSPSMGEYCIGREIDKVLRQAEFTTAVAR
jgi:hypothetical protein